MRITTNKNNFNCKANIMSNVYKTYDYSQLIQLSWGKDWFDLPSITYRTEILQKNHIAIAECFYADIEYDYLPLRYVKNFVFLDLSIYRYFIGRAGQSVSRPFKNYS